jgi:hypothetical protein
MFGQATGSPEYNHDAFHKYRHPVKLLHWCWKYLLLCSLGSSGRGSMEGGYGWLRGCLCLLGCLCSQECCLCSRKCLSARMVARMVARMFVLRGYVLARPFVLLRILFQRMFVLAATEAIDGLMSGCLRRRS